MVQRFRRRDFLDRDDIVELDQCAVISSHIELTDIRWFFTMPIVDFHDYLILTAILHERVHRPSAEQGLQRPPDGDNRHSEVGALVAMRFNGQVRSIQQSIHSGRHKSGMVGQPCDQFVGGLLQLLIIQSANDKLHWRLIQPFANGRRIQQISLHTGQLAEFLIQACDDLLLTLGALIPILQRHPTLGTVDPRWTVAEGHHRIRMGNLRDRLEQRFQFFGIGIGIPKGGALRCGEEARKPSRVLERR